MNLYLAPMEGVTDRVFRQAYCRCFEPLDKYFAPFLTPNENGKLGPRDLAQLDPERNPGCLPIPQILTNQAEGFIRTAAQLKRMGYQEINLNLGCPSGTVVSKGRGAGFLAFPEQLDGFLYQVCSAMESMGVKLSVKTRIGVEQPEEFEVLLEIYNRYAMEELIIHPRVRKDFYKNTPRMDVFRKAFAESRNPVCYNGDIFRKEDLDAAVSACPGLDRVMIGRGLASNPGLAQQIRTGRPVSREQFLEFYQLLYSGYKEQLLQASGQRVVLFRMKEMWEYMIGLFPDSKKQKKRILKSQNLAEYEAAVRDLIRECPFAGEEESYAAVSGH